MPKNQNQTKFNYQVIKFNPKKQKKYKHFIQSNFKNELKTFTQLPLRSRLRIARIVIFKNLKLINFQ